MNFDELNLAPAILRAVQEQGYTAPTPIQAQAIPLVLEGHDLLAGAQTGTGKTAGFALPLLQRLSGSDEAVASNSIRALVLVPTRELAEQVMTSFRQYGEHLAVSSYAAYGGVYVFVAIGWLWVVDGIRPTPWDIAGAAMAMAGMGVIMFAPRSA